MSDALFIKSSGLPGGRGSGKLALPLLPCMSSRLGKWVSWMDLIQKQHSIIDSLGTHAGRGCPTSLWAAKTTVAHKT